MIYVLSQSTIISLRTVNVDRGPRISFPDTNIPLATGSSPDQSSVNKQTTIPRNQSGFYSQPNPASTNQPFSIDRLAAGSNSQGSQANTPYQSPTPPPEEDESYDDPDAMEWTPTQETFRPSHRVNPAEVTASFPVPPFSSFKRLPPAPRAPAAKLRTAVPASKPSFKSHSEEPQNSFKRFTTQTSIGRQEEAEKSQKNDMVISPPQFFPEAGQSASTGLESLFDAAFSIRDEPVEVRGTLDEQTRHPSSSSSQSAHRRQTSAAAPYINILSIILRILALFTWNYSVKQPFQLSAVGINVISTLAAAIPGIPSYYSLYIQLLLSALLTINPTLYPPIIPTHLITHTGTFLYSLMLAQNIRWLMISLKKSHHPQDIPNSTDMNIKQEPSLPTTPTPSISSSINNSSTYSPSLSSSYNPASTYTRTSASTLSNPSTWSIASSTSSRPTRTSGASYSSMPFSSTSSRSTRTSGTSYSSIPSSSSSSTSSTSGSISSTSSNRTITPFSSSYTPMSRREEESDDDPDI